MNAAAFLACEFAACGCEADRNDAHARWVAAVDEVGQLGCANPWGSKHFKRRVGAAADGNVRGFEQSDAGVEQGRLQRSHVWRWVYPGDSGVEQVLPPLPAIHFDDGELHIDVALLGEHAG